jgi:ribonuclease HII
MSPQLLRRDVRSLGHVTLRRAPRRPLTKKDAPTRSIEKELWLRGYPIVVGIDEVGRGAWAGPLTVGAAVLPPDKRLNGIRDSKMLTEVDRERLFQRVGAWCATWGVGHASQVECDELGMAAAQRLAAGRAIAQLSVVPDAAIVDGTWDFVSPYVRHVERVVKADARCLVVAAASILAKVTRDRVMRDQSEHYPAWGFDSNKGYPCQTHLAALQAWGPSTIHRRSWVFMDHYIPWTGIQRYRRPGLDDQPTLFDEVDEVDELEDVDEVEAFGDDATGSASEWFVPETQEETPE